MKCTPRDEELFRLICRHNLLSTKQIHAQVFPALKLTTVMRRLKKLEQGRLLKRVGRLYSGTSVWGNSQEANDRTTGFFSSSRTNLHTLEHDVTVTDIHLLLEKITKIEEWLDVRHIRSGSIGDPFEKDFGVFEFGKKGKDPELMPDSLFIAKHQGKRKTFSLEVELSVKAQSRYHELIDTYVERKEPKLVLYVVRDLKVRNAVFKAAKNHYKAKEKIHAVFLDELLAKKEKAVAARPEFESVFIHQIFDCPNAVPRTVHSLAHPVDKRVDGPIEGEQNTEPLES